MEFDFDVAVIGLGSAGENLAKTLADRGKNVIAFEEDHVGGECPFFACIPSKSMLHDAASTDRSWSEATERRDELVNQRDDVEHAAGVKEAGVTIKRQKAVISGENQVSTSSDSHTAARIVIATGASAVKPPIGGLDTIDYWTSRNALSSGERPQSLLVVGGGAIGCELSEVYARYGSDVILVERSDHLVQDIEPSLSKLLTGHLEKLGVEVRLGEEVDSVSPTDHGRVSVELSHGQSIVDRVLLAAGVKPRLGNLGLESIGLDPAALTIESDGSVGGLDWLWAAGDVTPHSAWTHSANHQARRLADRFCDQLELGDDPPMPRCIFTNPPVGIVGLTSKKAAEGGVNTVVGRASYESGARAATDELADGQVCIIADRSTGQIIGCSALGPRADDLIHIVVALMAGKVTVASASRLVFAFPTLAEVIQVAIRDADRQIQSD